MLNLLPIRFFSKAGLKQPNVKQFNTISKLQHIRLNFKEIDQNLHLIKQNVINRNAS
jgi:hypothetical protein